MENELIVCIPGPWKNNGELVKAVVTATGLEYMFAGSILARPSARDHIVLELCERDEMMENAFRAAGQGKLTEETLNKIAQHQGVAYLHFPLDIVAQRYRLKDFTEVIFRSGGFAVKLESSGVAHEWERWFSLIESDNPFDTYCACVTLVADEAHYYSCGMHHFGLPDSQLSRTVPIQEAADLMNRFNYYQIIERPKLGSGHTFSLTEDSPHLRLTLLTDNRHSDDDLYHNPNGLWELSNA